jgi:hypothetical protein
MALVFTTHWKQSVWMTMLAMWKVELKMDMTWWMQPMWNEQKSGSLEANVHEHVQWMSVG